MAKLESGFDPIWQSDLIDLRKMSSKAFILRQMYRLYRNTETNIVNLPDLTISQITGWDRKTIRLARSKLIELKEIIPQGYHTFKINPFHRLKSCGETPQPDKNNLGRNSPTSCGETPQPVGRNSPTSCGETAQPLLTDTRDKDIKDTFSSLSPVKKPVNNSTVLCCKDCANYLRDPADRDNKRSSPCSILKIKLPPFTVAAHCENFSNLFEK
jgi:hypothetical protein